MSRTHGGGSGGYNISTDLGPYKPVTDAEREVYGQACYRAAMTVADNADNVDQARELLEALELDRGLAELRATYGRQP